MKKIYTTQQVQKEIMKAKKRLNTFSSHSGNIYSLDEEYFKALTPKKAVEKLTAIRWSNTKKEKGGVSYVGLKVDDKPLKKVRIRREEPVKIAKKRGRKAYITDEIRHDRQLKHDIKVQLDRLDRNLKTFEKHTGLKFSLKEDYINGMSVEQLRNLVNSLTWTKLKKSTNLDMLDIRSINEHPLSKILMNVELTEKELIYSMKRKEKTWGKPQPVKIYTKTDQKRLVEYYDKYGTDAKKKAFEARNRHLAEQNLINNFSHMANAGDRLTKAVATMVVDLYHEGILTIDNTPAYMHDLGVDMFDSEVPEEELIANAERILKGLINGIGAYSPVISKAETRKRLLEKGLTDDDIDEII